MGVEEVALESCELSRSTAGQEYLGAIVEGYGTPLAWGRGHGVHGGGTELACGGQPWPLVAER